MFLALDLLFGKLLSAYAPFNMWANCVVIIVNIILIWLVDTIHLNDGFRVSFNTLFPFLGFIEIVSIAFSRPQLEDNGAIVFVLLAILLQLILLLNAYHVSKTIQ